MKLIMWLITCVSLAGTVITLLFMPEQMPVHYNISGNIDRWGSKYEWLIFPAVILAFSLLWTFLIRYLEKLAARIRDAGKKTAVLKNVKVFRITGIIIAAVFAVLLGIFLYRACCDLRSGSALFFNSFSVGEQGCNSCDDC